MRGSNSKDYIRKFNLEPALEADEMQIRDVVDSDLAAIACLQARTMVASDFYDTALNEDAEYQRLYPRIVGYLAGTYNPSYALAERAVFVAEHEEQVIGFIAGHRSTRQGCTAELQWLFVLPHWQRKGIGARLLGSLQNWFIDQGRTRVIVDAAPENPSRSFYLKYGAVPLDTYWLYWKDIGEGLGL